jgi:hypothetical protein
MVIKSRGIDGGDVVCMGEKRNTYRVLVGKTEGNNYLEDLRTDGRIMLKWILKKKLGTAGIGLNWIRLGKVVNFISSKNIGLKV